jgi:hypothetical protein
MSTSPFQLSAGQDEVKIRTALVSLIKNGWELKSEIELHKTYHFETLTKSVVGTFFREFREANTPVFVQRDSI